MLGTLALTGVALGLLFVHISSNQPLVSASGFAILGYQVVSYLIPRLGSSFIKIGLKGTDLSKASRPVLPECMGAIASVVYLFVMFFFIPFIFIQILIVNTSGGGNRDVEYQDTISLKFPHSKLVQYLSAILCLESQILLGIADDLFDVKWRHKFFMPAVAAIPLLIVYYIDFGATTILIPNVVSQYLHQTTVDLGVGYYLYMAAIAIFCPNSINILAGVNGLEVGQSVVLALIFLTNDFCYIFLSQFPQSISSHMFSACLLIPFLGVSLGLLKYNWFPAQVFVGDTYCYFAGMVFAVVGILGHFSKTLLLFFIPQIFNFVYSVPQLFHLVPIPRHRMPRLDEPSGLLHPSMAVLVAGDTVELTTKFKLAQLIARVLLGLKLVRAEECTVTVAGTGTKFQAVKQISNLTLINLVLVAFGPMREDVLCLTILAIQFAIGLLAIGGRHTVGPFLFGYDNLWS